MHELHSCIVTKREHGMVSLSSISGKYDFEMFDYDPEIYWLLIFTQSLKFTPQLYFVNLTLSVRSLKTT